MRLKWITMLGLFLLFSAVLQQVTLADEAAPAQTIPITSKGFSAKLAPDGKTLVTFENILLLDLKENVPALLPMHVIDVSTGKEITQLSGYSDYTADVAFTSGGKRMISIQMNGDLNIWDVATWKITKTYQTPLMGYYLPIDVFPDNNHILLLSGSSPQRLLVFDLQTGTITKMVGKHFDSFLDFRTKYTDMANRLNIDLAAFALSPDGKRVATAAQSDEVGLWSIEDNQYQLLRKQSDRPGLFSVRQLVFTPDGKSLIYFDASDDKTHIWDIASATEKAALDIGGEAFVLSSDGKMLAWATRIKDQPNTISFASLDAPDKAAVLLTLPDDLKVGPMMTSVAFTLNGKQLVASGFFSSDETQNQIYILNVPAA